MLPLSNERFVEQHFALDGVGDRRGEHFPAGEVLFAEIVDGLHTLDGHREVCRVARDDVYLVGRVEEVHHPLLVLPLCIPVLVYRTVDELLVGFRAHLRQLGIARRGELGSDPTFAHPFSLDGSVGARSCSGLLGRNVARLRRVLRASDDDYRVRLLQGGQRVVEEVDIVHVTTS
jgi:hypothetical protein